MSYCLTHIKRIKPKIHGTDKGKEFSEKVRDI
jgi:hypothetical protein